MAKAIVVKFCIIWLCLHKRACVNTTLFQLLQCRQQFCPQCCHLANSTKHTHHLLFWPTSPPSTLSCSIFYFSPFLPYTLAYKPTICGSISTFKHSHTARVDSQHDGCLSATLTVCVPLMAWTISRSLGLRGCVGESTSAGF